MKFAVSAALLALAFSPVLAAPAPVLRYIDSEYDANVAKGLRLVKLGQDIEPSWVTEEDKLEFVRAKTGFFDITETYHVRKELEAKAKTEPKVLVTYPPISHQTQVKALIASISTSNMISTLSTLTALNNRYYKSSTGAQASTLIYNKLVSIAGSTSGITISQFKHSWNQTSVIAKFAGTGAATIFGCHLDSINQNSPTSGRAPGADDNGTGVVNLIEIFRALIASGFKPISPIEFHFNSAEEGGLLGSQAIAAAYKKAGTQVKAYVNLDMTAYFQPGSKEVIALETDYIDESLNTYLRSLISEYCAIPAGEDYCGYACSDHASWYDQGYPSSMPFEAPTANENPYIHTTSDTTSVDGFSWTHSFVRQTPPHSKPFTHIILGWNAVAADDARSHNLLYYLVSVNGLLDVGGLNSPKAPKRFGNGVHFPDVNPWGVGVYSADLTIT